MNLIKISTDLELSVHEFPTGTHEEQNNKLRELIGNDCRLYEHVMPKRLYTELHQMDHPTKVKGQCVSMLIDEEGLLKEVIIPNLIGSYLYETDKHNIPITGNILIVKEIVEGIPAPTPEEVETAKKNNSSVYIGVVGAVTKLQEELKKAKDKSFADPIIKHLIERCRESESLASDVCQDHKTWEKCYKYIYEQARKQAKGSSCAVLDDAHMFPTEQIEMANMLNSEFATETEKGEAAS